MTESRTKGSNECDVLANTVQSQLQNAVGRVTHEFDGDIRKEASYYPSHLMSPHTDRLVTFAQSLPHIARRGPHTEKGQGPLLRGPRQGHDHSYHEEAAVLDC